MKLHALLVTGMIFCSSLFQVSLAQEETLSVCTDISVDMTFQLQHEEETEEDEELSQRTGSCLRSPLIQLLLSDMKEVVPNSILDLPDCFEVSVQQGQTSAHRMFPVFSLCSRSSTDMTLDDWFNEILVGLEDFFGPKQSYNNPEHPKKILIGKLDVEVQPFAMSVPYPMPLSQSTAVPKLNMISSQLWSVASLDDDTFSSFANLTVSNIGDAPLSIFRVIITKVDHNGDILVFTAQDPVYIDPRATGSFLLETRDEQTSFQREIYEMYVSHNGFKSHLFEGQIMNTDFIPLQKLDKLINGKKKRTAEVNYGAIRSTDPSLSHGIYQSWKAISMMIVCSVGVFAMLFVRRKAAQIDLKSHSNCFRFRHQRVKHKSSILDVTLSSSQKDAKDEIEQESLLQTTKKHELSPTNGSGSRAWDIPKVPKLTRSISNSSTGSNGSPMPAITMQWKRPTRTNITAKPKLSSRTRRLDLDKQVRLHPKHFESMWDEFVDRNTYNITGIEKSPDSQLVVKKMEEIGIVCMASGTVQGVDKLLFYGKQKNENEQYFFLSIDITQASVGMGLQIIQSIRTSRESSEQLVQEFASITRKVLTDLTSN